MVTDWKNSNIHQETLTNEVRTLEEEMKSLLSIHLAQEKELRAER
jgi:dsDNA-binding SOS-regulon protein